MTTALQIINRSAEILGYKDPDEDLSGSEVTSFLGVLNSMVDAWATASQPLLVYAVTLITQSVSGNPVGIGTGATINTPRPVNIPAGGFVRVGTTDYRFDMITREQYDAFRDKSISTGYPRFCYYEAALPTGNLYFYPALSGSQELHLPIEQRLAAFADLATDYTLAPGVRGALEYSLVEELAPGRRPLDPQVQRLAAIKRRNIETFEPGMLVTGFERPQGNILTGWNQ